MIIQANVKDLYLVLIALSFLCAGLGGMVMWLFSEWQHERHMQEFRDMIQMTHTREVVTYADNAGDQATDR